MRTSLYCLSLIMLATAYAGDCNQGQHCFSCDSKNGYCTTDCDTGYFDLKCSSACNAGCRNNACRMTSNGIESCTDGCNPGLYGTRCSNECDVSDCKLCNRYTGVCDECIPPYGGLYCNQTCGNCIGICGVSCSDGCLSGSYGPFCSRNCSVNCKDGCHQDTGECTSGCEIEWFGSNCASRCTQACVDSLCDINGVCIKGCKPGFYGSDCYQCLQHCFNGICQKGNGSCTGCNRGFYGEFCNKTCATCHGGLCKQSSGDCIEGCILIYTGTKCQTNCTLNCSLTECTSVDVCKETMLLSATDTTIELPSIYIFVIAGILIIVIMVSTIAVLCYLRRHKSETDKDVGKRELTSEQHTENRTSYLVANNTYWEINEDDIYHPYSEINEDQIDPSHNRRTAKVISSRKFTSKQPREDRTSDAVVSHPYLEIIEDDDPVVSVLAECFEQPVDNGADDIVEETPTNYSRLLHNCNDEVVGPSHLTPAGDKVAKHSYLTSAGEEVVESSYLTPMRSEVVDPDPFVPVLAECFEQLADNGVVDVEAENPTNYSRLLHNFNLEIVESSYLTPAGDKVVEPNYLTPAGDEVVEHTYLTLMRSEAVDPDRVVPVLAECFEQPADNGADDMEAETPTNYSRLLHNCNDEVGEPSYLTPMGGEVVETNYLTPVGDEF